MTATGDAELIYAVFSGFRPTPADRGGPLGGRHLGATYRGPVPPVASSAEAVRFMNPALGSEWPIPGWPLLTRDWRPDRFDRVIVRITLVHTFDWSLEHAILLIETRLLELLVELEIA